MARKFSMYVKIICPLVYTRNPNQIMPFAPLRALSLSLSFACTVYTQVLLAAPGLFCFSFAWFCWRWEPEIEESTWVSSLCAADLPLHYLGTLCTSNYAKHCVITGSHYSSAPTKTARQKRSKCALRDANAECSLCLSRTFSHTYLCVALWTGQEEIFWRNQLDCFSFPASSLLDVVCLRVLNVLCVA